MGRGMKIVIAVVLGAIAATLSTPVVGRASVLIGAGIGFVAWQVLKAAFGNARPQRVLTEAQEIVARRPKRSYAAASSDGQEGASPDSSR